MIRCKQRSKMKQNGAKEMEQNAAKRSRMKQCSAMTAGAERSISQQVGAAISLLIEYIIHIISPQQNGAKWSNTEQNGVLQSNEDHRSKTEQYGAVWSNTEQRGAYIYMDIFSGIHIYVCSSLKGYVNTHQPDS